MEDEINWLDRVSPENAAEFKCTSSTLIYVEISDDTQTHSTLMGTDGLPDIIGC
jgi:hypothetical protein